MPATINKMQRDHLEDAALMAFGGTLSPLAHGFRIVSPRGQLAAIYWSNNDGNEVEIAICDSRLTDRYDLRLVQAWLEIEQKRSGSTCNIHKADSDWPIIGFKLTDTASFLSKCARFRRGLLRPEELAELEALKTTQAPEEAELADLKAELARLRPLQRKAVIDLVYRAGISIASWYIKTDGSPAASPRSNPSYCYEWCFGGGNREPVLLCIWHESLVVDGGAIRLRENLRRSAARLEAIANTSGEHPDNRLRARDQARRARKFDALVSYAASGQHTVKVILNEGMMRSEENIGKESSVVKVRRLDENVWKVQSYSGDTGEFELVREASQAQRKHSEITPTLDADQNKLLKMADQFSLGSDEPERRKGESYSLVRDPAVRQAVLQRSRGVCEFCYAEGFRMTDGRVYLETHHVEPLAQGGADRVWNVVALCPNDHKEAHYGERSAAIRQELLQFLHDQRPE